MSRPGPRHHRRLAALVVNYNAGAFAERCVQSLIAEWLRERRDRADLEVVVVDNASPQPQEPWLTAIEGLGVTVIRSGENLGYARAINLAYDRTRGEPGDVVAILNPDLWFLPGSIGTLIDTLAERPRIGCVDPRTFIDHGKVLGLPRNPLPSPLELIRTSLAVLHPVFGKWYVRRRVRHSTPWWTSDEPIETTMLSGCCVFLRRAVVDELGGRPMDPRYPLYYEDTDLFLSVEKLGYRNLHQVRAEVLHHWSRSSGVGEEFEQEPRRRQRIGEYEYLNKFHGRLVAEVVTRIHRWTQTRSYGRQQSIHEVVDLGEVADPPELVLPRSCRFVVELGLGPNWLLACGAIGEGDRWRCPPEAWEWFFATRVFLRAIEVESGAFLGAWSFVKTTPGRTGPMDLDAETAAVLRGEALPS